MEPKWLPGGGALGCPNGSPGPSRETPGDANDPLGSSGTSRGRLGAILELILGPETMKITIPSSGFASFPKAELLPDV